MPMGAALYLSNRVDVHNALLIIMVVTGVLANAGIAWRPDLRARTSPPPPPSRGSGSFRRRVRSPGRETVARGVGARAVGRGADDPWSTGARGRIVILGAFGAVDGVRKDRGAQIRILPRVPFVLG